MDDAPSEAREKVRARLAVYDICRGYAVALAEQIVQPREVQKSLPSLPGREGFDGWEWVEGLSAGRCDDAV